MVSYRHTGIFYLAAGTAVSCAFSGCLLTGGYETYPNTTVDTEDKSGDDVSGASGSGISLGGGSDDKDDFDKQKSRGHVDVRQGETTAPDTTNPQCSGDETRCRGKCIDLSKSIENCGLCSRECPSLPNTRVRCTSGTCQYRCLSGWVDVNRDLSKDHVSNSDGCTCPASRSVTWVPDADGDGFGALRLEIMTCGDNRPGRDEYLPLQTLESVNQPDCDDTDASQFPGRRERCNQRDDDCDRQIDETCSCRSGHRQSCGTTQGVCTSGTQTCADNQWGPCRRSLMPTSEICDGKDNDCDGSVDESFPKLGTECTVGSGICTASGQFECLPDGSGVSCSASPQWNKKQPEICDGRDNDCNGRTDEAPFADREHCAKQKGVCNHSLRDCRDGDYQPCNAHNYGDNYEPREQSCDGLDNDCDGHTDETCFCNYRGLEAGVCGAPQVHRNSEGSCLEPDGYERREQSCDDGLDNDCDSTADCADDDCDDSFACAQRIFTTRKRFPSNFGRSGSGSPQRTADKKCRQQAGRANLSGGPWRAIISTPDTPAASYISIRGPVYNLGGERVARNHDDFFDGALEHSLKYTARGTRIKGPIKVWTGTDRFGQRASMCNDWSMSRKTTGTYGHADSMTSTWLQAGTTTCGPPARYRLYCIGDQR